MYQNVDLKNKNASYFISKMGLIEKSRGIVSRDKQAITNTIGKSSQQRRDHYREKGGNSESFFKLEYIGGKQELRVVMVSHWLSCWARKEIFLPPAGVVKKYRCISSCRGCK